MTETTTTTTTTITSSSLTKAGYAHMEARMEGDGYDLSGGWPSVWTEYWDEAAAEYGELQHKGIAFVTVSERYADGRRYFAASSGDHGDVRIYRDLLDGEAVARAYLGHEGPWASVEHDTPSNSTTYWRD